MYPFASILTRFRGLRMKATAVLCSVVLVATVSTAALYIRMATRLVTDQAQSRVCEIAQALAAAAAEPVVTSDTRALLGIATQVITGDHIRYVAFADPGGHVLAGAQMGEGQLSELLRPDGRTIAIEPLHQPITVQDANHEPRLDVTYPIFAPGSNDAPDARPPSVGFVRLGLSLADVNRQAAAVTEKGVGVAALIAALMIPLGFGLVNRLIVPLRRLGDAARSLAAGRLDQRVEQNRTDEIGELAAAFNNMADDLSRSHRELLRHQEELEDHVLARTYQLSELNRRMQEEVAEKDDFLRAVSHDLSAPLRNVTGMTTLLRDRCADQLAPEAADLLQRIDHSVRVELELIDELLELSHIRTRRGEMQRMDLTQIVRDLTRQFSADLLAKRIDVQIEPDLPVIYADRTRMRQLWQNLIDNAIKYTDPAERSETGPVIRVSCVDRPDVYEFRVADSGIGVAPRDRDRIFYVFRRAKDGFVAKTAGKGVGLATCKSIVQCYMGRIWVEPNPGGGSIFCFTLAKSKLVAAPSANPIHDAALAARSGPPQRAPIPAEAAP